MQQGENYIQFSVSLILHRTEKQYLHVFMLVLFFTQVHLSREADKTMPCPFDLSPSPYAQVDVGSAQMI